MYRFECDYLEGAVPEVLAALCAAAGFLLPFARRGLLLPPALCAAAAPFAALCPARPFIAARAPRRGRALPGPRPPLSQIPGPLPGVCLPETAPGGPY